MIQFIKTISNPLTIIAMFAALAEVFGTVTIGFMAPSTQQIFVWFLVGFPSMLVLLFFMTLNFNRAALYAPSDYKDEGNYMDALRGQAVAKSLEALDESLAAVRTTLGEQHTTANEKVATLTRELITLQKRVNEAQISTNEILYDNPTDLSAVQQSLLSVLRGKSMTLAELAEHSNLEIGQIERAVGGLEVRQLVHRGRRKGPDGHIQRVYVGVRDPTLFALSRGELAASQEPSSEP